VQAVDVVKETTEGEILQPHKWFFVQVVDLAAIEKGPDAVLEDGLHKKSVEGAFESFLMQLQAKTAGIMGSWIESGSKFCI